MGPHHSSCVDLPEETSSRVAQTMKGKSYSDFLQNVKEANKLYVCERSSNSFEHLLSQTDATSTRRATALPTPKSSYLKFTVIIRPGTPDLNDLLPFSWKISNNVGLLLHRVVVSWDDGGMPTGYAPGGTGKTSKTSRRSSRRSV